MTRADPQPPAQTSADAPRLANSLRSLGRGVYLPSALYGVGQGAIAPIVAVTAVERGGSIGTAGLIVALLGIGQLVGDVPAGMLAARLGERRAMLAASVFALGCIALCVVSSGLVLLGVAVFGIGLSTAVWFLARHAYITDVVPVELRGRALSALGGVQRLGRFVGPFLGAVGIHFYGTRTPYVMDAAFTAVAAILLLTLRDDPTHTRPASTQQERPSLWSVTMLHRRVFYTLGFATMMTTLVRASRQAVIPLWGHQLGLDPSVISIIFGLSNAIELFLVYPAGWLMDRYGRASVAVPSMTIMAVSLFILVVNDSMGIFIASALLMGIGNGISSGIIMTLGSDASPQIGRPEFLSVWRLCVDVGNSAGPLLLSAVAAAATLSAAVVSTGAGALIGAWALFRFVPRARRSR